MILKFKLDPGVLSGAGWVKLPLLGAAEIEACLHFEVVRLRAVGSEAEVTLPRSIWTEIPGSELEVLTVGEAIFVRSRRSA